MVYSLKELRRLQLICGLAVGLLSGCKAETKKGPAGDAGLKNEVPTEWQEPVGGNWGPSEQASSSDEISKELDALSLQSINASGGGLSAQTIADPKVREGCWVEPFWRHRIFRSSYLIGHCQSTQFQMDDAETKQPLVNKTFSLKIFSSDGARELYRSNVYSDSYGVASTGYMHEFYDLPFKICLNDEFPVSGSGMGFVFKKYMAPVSCHSGVMPSQVPYFRTRNYDDLFHKVKLSGEIKAAETMSLDLVELITTGSYCPSDPIVISGDTYTVKFPFPYNYLGLLGFCRKLDTQFSVEVVDQNSNDPIADASVKVEFGPESAPVFAMSYTTDQSGKVTTNRFSRVRGVPYRVCVSEKNSSSRCVSGTTASNANLNNLDGEKAIKIIRNFKPVGGISITGKQEADESFGNDAEIEIFAYDPDNSTPLQIRLKTGGVTKQLTTNFASASACNAVAESCGKENTGVKLKVSDLGLSSGGPYQLSFEVLNKAVAGQEFVDVEWIDFGESDFNLSIKEVAYFKKPSEVDAAYKMIGAPSSYNYGGWKEYWIRTEVPNKFNAKFLFITPSGEMYAWNPSDRPPFSSGNNMKSEKIAELDPQFYKVVHKVIAGIDDPTIPAQPVFALASEVDRSFGLIGNAYSRNWGGGDELWIKTTTLTDFGQKNVYILPNGEVWAWNPEDKKGFLTSGLAVKSKKVGSLNANFHGNPASLIGGIDYPEDIDRVFEFQGKVTSVNWGGLNEKWIVGKSHEFGKFYFITPNGLIYKWNPADTKATFAKLLNSVLVGAVAPSFYTNTQDLINAHVPK